MQIGHTKTMVLDQPLVRPFTFVRVIGAVIAFRFSFGIVGRFVDTHLLLSDSLYLWGTPADQDQRQTFKIALMWNKVKVKV